MKEIFLRIYAACPRPEAAQAIATCLLLALQDHDPKIINPPYPYWKMPELYGFDIQLHPASEKIFLQLVASPEGQWTHMGDGYDRSSVWNPGKDGDYFLVPQARWAEVQFTVREA